MHPVSLAAPQGVSVIAIIIHPDTVKQHTDRLDPTKGFLVYRSPDRQAAGCPIFLTGHLAANSDLCQRASCLRASNMITLQTERLIGISGQVREGQRALSLHGITKKQTTQWKHVRLKGVNQCL